MLNRLQFMFERVLNVGRLQDGSLSGLGCFLLIIGHRAWSSFALIKIQDGALR